MSVCSYCGPPTLNGPGCSLYELCLCGCHYETPVSAVGGLPIETKVYALRNEMGEWWRPKASRSRSLKACSSWNVDIRRARFYAKKSVAKQVASVILHDMLWSRPSRNVTIDVVEFDVKQGSHK